MEKKQMEYLQTGRLAKNPEPGMTLIEAIRTRRTVRTYQDKLVPIETLKELLLESTHAPNSCNRRGWRFIFIQDPDELNWLYKHGSAAFIRKTKQAVLVCYLSKSDNAVWSDIEQSAAAAMAYFQLISHTHGIGSCWVCHLPSKREIRKHFGIPRNFTPIALLTLGYYKPTLKMVPRVIGNKDIFSMGKWNFENEIEEGYTGFKYFCKKVLRKIYYILPFRGAIREFTHKYEKKFDNEIE